MIFKHIKSLLNKINESRLKMIEKEFIYEDYKDIAKITYEHPFDHRDIKAIVEGCTDFLDHTGPFSDSHVKLRLFLKDMVTAENYREWIKRRGKH